MELPVTVRSIEWVGYDEPPIVPDRIFGGEAGAWVAVRVAGEETTHIGILLGEYHPPAVAYRAETGALVVRKHTFGNPAIWVPDLKRVVMGYECWWGEIKSEQDLRQITDADIENIWYVKVLKSLQDSASSQP